MSYLGYILYLNVIFRLYIISKCHILGYILYYIIFYYKLTIFILNVVEPPTPFGLGLYISCGFSLMGHCISN